MPYQHTIEPEQRLITISGSGSGDFREVEAHFAAMMQDPELRPDYDMLVLVSGIQHQASDEDIREFVELYGHLREFHQGRIAVVDGRPGQRTANELIAAMFENMRIFTCEADARTWLGTR